MAVYADGDSDGAIDLGPWSFPAGCRWIKVAGATADAIHLNADGQVSKIVAADGTVKYEAPC